MGGRGGRSGPLHADDDRAGEHHGHGEDGVGDTLVRGRGLAGEQVLIDGGRALGDVPVDGNRLPGGHAHQVSGLDRVQRGLDLHPAHAHPDGAGLPAEDVGVVGAGIAPDLVEQPAGDLEGEVVQAEEEHVPVGHAERVDPDQEPVDRHLSIPREGPPALHVEAAGGIDGDGDGEQGQGRIDDGRQPRHDEGQPGEGQVPPRPRPVHREGLGRARRDRRAPVALGVDEGLVEDAQEPLAIDPGRIVGDQGGGGARAGDVALDAEGVAQRPLDRGAQRPPPADQPVAEADAARQLVPDLPGRQQPAVALDPPAFPVRAGGREVAGRVHVGRAVAVLAVAEVARDLGDHRSARHHAVDVLDLGPGSRGQDLDGPHLLDLEDPPDELATGLGRGVPEEVAADEPHLAVPGMGDHDVDGLRFQGPPLIQAGRAPRQGSG